MSFVEKLKEVYEPDIESAELPLEFAKHIITRYLGMAQEEGVKELIMSGDIPEDGPGDLVQDVIDQLVPKLEKYVSSGKLPLA